MDDHVKEFYNQTTDQAPHGNFHKVMIMQDHLDLSWKDLKKKAPATPKGWYELAHLNIKDRIEFTRDFWLATMPYHPKIMDSITQFFRSLKDIEIVITQKKFDDPWVPNLVYILKEKRGFFRGYASAQDKEIESLAKLFPGYAFPVDYLAFLRIHNGFSKSTDCGIVSLGSIRECNDKFQGFLKNSPPLITEKANVIDPKTLVPFYKSFDLPCYQCFWSEWYPSQEIGNVYYSDLTKTISNVETEHSYVENLAFPTFTDWLIFYLEKIV